MHQATQHRYPVTASRIKRLFPAIILFLILVCSQMTRGQEDDGPIDTDVTVLPEPSITAKPLTKKVFYGATPNHQGDFQYLKDRGVKTIISVDAATPDRELAEKHSISYVHLPIGYQQIETPRALDLSKATATLPGKIYIHCHLGKHRAPVAAIVACVGNGSLDPESIADILEQAETDFSYEALVRSAQIARKFSDQRLQYHDISGLDAENKNPTTEFMSQLVKPADRLFRAFRTRYSIQPDVLPNITHDALMIAETFTELCRSIDAATIEINSKQNTGQRTANPSTPTYRERMIKTRDTALAIHQKLSLPPSNQAFGLAETSNLVKKLEQQCTDCHRDHR